MLSNILRRPRTPLDHLLTHTVLVGVTSTYHELVIACDVDAVGRHAPLCLFMDHGHNASSQRMPDTRERADITRDLTAKLAHVVSPRTYAVCGLNWFEMHTQRSRYRAPLNER